MGAAPGGGEGQGAQPVPPMPMQMMNFAPLKGSVNKDYTYNARGQGEPHNIDKLGETRKSDDDPTKEPENWVEGVIAKGYLTPIIKQVSNDGKKMWFSQDGIDFIANLHPTGVTHVEKATFGMGPVYKTPQGEHVKYSTTSNSESREYDPYDEEDENAQ